MAWDPNARDFQVFNIVDGLLVEGLVRGFEEKVCLLNVYAPCRDRLPFRKKVESSGILYLENLVLGGDLNLTLGATEVWGGTSLIDPLAGYFKDLFVSTNLVDISLAHLAPTWRNGRLGQDRVAKRLDHFLVSGELVDRLGRYRCWNSFDYISNHLPVSLQVEFEYKRLHYPFKFNKIWLPDEEFWSMVTEGVDRDLLADLTHRKDHLLNLQEIT